YKDNPDTLEAIRESSNEMSATLRVSVKELNNQQSLNNFVKTDDLYKKYKDPNREPSFSGERQQAIKTVGSWVRLASIGGSIATVVFVVISSLVVFNTIRMAIFNRKDEIEMMKLIGAERSFIRGPFIVEAIMYGFIAAIIATVVGYGLLILAHDPMVKYGIPIDNLLNHLKMYGVLVFLSMILVGAAIGVASSWVATRKYLKL
ncbi:MAG: FtsX-like permease family protein, partial [Candidatus Nanosynbacter sp.]|nr:FtsX-like permease family protein [Candidatus Nanosynbacter sp.]